MPIEFPLSPEKIREEMKRIISEIRDETDWELKWNLSELTIEIGNAPMYGPIFGINRDSKKIAFGSWLEELTPKYYRNNLVEFLIIRESLSCFIENELLLETNFTLVFYILNLCALAYMRKKYEKKYFETKLFNIRERFLFEDDQLNDEERFFQSKFHSLATNVVSQQITYKHLLETFLHFLEESSYSELDEYEILDHIYRYLSNIPEEIVAPIRLKLNTLQVLEKVVDMGFDATASNIAEILGKDHTTIYREFKKIASRYNAYFRVQKNFHKLGLHFYLILIRLNKNNDDNVQRTIDELCKVRYVGIISEGKGDNFHYIYSITLCPHFVADSLGNKFEKMMKNQIIKSFEIKPLKNRIYMTSFVEERFDSSIENYQKLIDGVFKCKKIETWNDNKFKQSPPMKFTEKERNLLRAISVYKSSSLANPQLYRVFTTQLKKFAVDNKIDINKLDDFLGFMNSQRNQLLEKELINFRLELTISDLAINDVLSIKVNCDTENEKTVQLIDKISIFSRIAFHITHDCIIIQILGLNNEHPITNLIIKLISKFGFEYEKFTIKQKVWRFIPLSELYHFQGNKWALY
ncbi:MAG: hypothetical protein FK733_10935 [Asgard group archaeon]|nr:hypothetical protein [Asgard group archaeon]